MERSTFNTLSIAQIRETIIIKRPITEISGPIEPSGIPLL